MHEGPGALAECWGNTFVCDTIGALGDPALAENPAVICPGVSAGRTAQAFELLSKRCWIMSARFWEHNKGL